MALPIRSRRLALIDPAISGSHSAMKLLCSHTLRHTHTHDSAEAVPATPPKGPNDEAVDCVLKWMMPAKNALFEDSDCDNYCHYQGGDLKKDDVTNVQL